LENLGVVCVHVAVGKVQRSVCGVDIPGHAYFLENASQSKKDGDGTLHDAAYITGNPNAAAKVLLRDMKNGPRHFQIWFS
jgi:hypothetical protein